MARPGEAHVLIIDDDADLCAMLGEYLEAEGFAVSFAHDGDAGMTAARQGGFDVVILDVMLPSRNGMEVLRGLRQTSEVPIVMLTARGDSIDRVVGLEMGADDYIPKPCLPRELVARLRAILRRGERPAARPETVGCGSLTVEVEARRATIGGRALVLTACEFDLLAMLARSGSKIATKDELSLKVLGRIRQSYDRSVDVHVSNLRQKLMTTPGAPAIETIRGVGYRLQP